MDNSQDQTRRFLEIMMAMGFRLTNIQPSQPALMDAQVIPYDPSRRRSKLDRIARKVRQQKRQQARDRKVHNEKVIKEMNLRKDKK